MDSNYNPINLKNYKIFQVNKHNLLKIYLHSNIIKNKRNLFGNLEMRIKLQTNPIEVFPKSVTEINSPLKFKEICLKWPESILKKLPDPTIVLKLFCPALTVIQKLQNSIQNFFKVFKKNCPTQNVNPKCFERSKNLFWNPRDFVQSSKSTKKFLNLAKVD